MQREPKETNPSPPPQRSWKRRGGDWGLRAAWAGGVLGVAGIVFAVTFFSAMRSENRSTQVEVPDLVGIPYEDAADRVAPLGLRVQVAGERNDPGVPSGSVLQQDPPADTSVKRGRKIKLVVSLGDKVLEVPDLVGEQARAVAIQLGRGGFIPGQEVSVPRWDRPRGAVIAQVPQASTAAMPNTRVHRLVSGGPPEAVWVMPELRGRFADGVRRALEGAGFRLSVRRVNMPGRAPGTVVGQLPPSGYPLRARSVVELTVAQ